MLSLYTKAKEYKIKLLKEHALNYTQATLVYRHYMKKEFTYWFVVEFVEHYAR